MAHRKPIVVILRAGQKVLVVCKNIKALNLTIFFEGAPFRRGAFF
ncbi:hypothetical protein [Gordoniibacillus kamchatkensis]|nr:hypothetical protein [Paenibacillus sp. VKM B-2647]